MPEHPEAKYFFEIASDGTVRAAQGVQVPENLPLAEISKCIAHAEQQQLDMLFLDIKGWHVYRIDDLPLSLRRAVFVWDVHRSHRPSFTVIEQLIYELFPDTWNSMLTLEPRCEIHGDYVWHNGDDEPFVQRLHAELLSEEGYGARVWKGTGLDDRQALAVCWRVYRLLNFLYGWSDIVTRARDKNLGASDIEHIRRIAMHDDSVAAAAAEVAAALVAPLHESVVAVAIEDPLSVCPTLAKMRRLPPDADS